MASSQKHKTTVSSPAGVGLTSLNMRKLSDFSSWRLSGEEPFWYRSDRNLPPRSDRESFTWRRGSKSPVFGDIKRMGSRQVMFPTVVGSRVTLRFDRALSGATNGEKLPSLATHNGERDARSSSWFRAKTSGERDRPFPGWFFTSIKAMRGVRIGSDCM